MTRKRLWEKHLAKYPSSYGYSQFCEHLARYLQKSDPTMVLSHQPGDAFQIDFAGTPLSYIDRITGEIIPSPVLACSLPYSSLTYYDPLESTRMEHLVPALNRAANYMGGITKWVLTDNMKQIVTRSCRYEPTFTELAEQGAVHYNTFFKAILAGKPKDTQWKRPLILAIRISMLHYVYSLICLISSRIFFIFDCFALYPLCDKIFI